MLIEGWFRFRGLRFGVWFRVWFRVGLGLV